MIDVLPLEAVVGGPPLLLPAEAAPLLLLELRMLSPVLYADDDVVLSVPTEHVRFTSVEAISTSIVSST